MLQPKRTKFRKMFRGRRRGMTKGGNDLSFGEFGLKSLEVGWLKAAQIEAARRTVTHDLKRKGMVWIRVYPDKPVTSRPAGKRMGMGKGEVSHWVAVVKPGRILIEIAGVPKEAALEAFKNATAKLPFKTKVVSKEDIQ